MMTEEEAARVKGNIKGDEDEGVKKIGTVNPIEDFKQMINDRKTDRV